MKIETIPNLNDYKSIKTYEDACDALGEKVPEDELTKAGVSNHIIALMKLELAKETVLLTVQEYGAVDEVTFLVNGVEYSSSAAE